MFAYISIGAWSKRCLDTIDVILYVLILYKKENPHELDFLTNLIFRNLKAIKNVGCPAELGISGRYFITS